MAVVYQHKRNDTNEIFYIGIGNDCTRAGKRANRNEEWHKIDKKYGFKWEVLIANISRNEAFDIEKGLISYYGRKDLGTGQLVNQTKGGDGCPTKELEYRENIYSNQELKEHIEKYHPRKNPINFLPLVYRNLDKDVLISKKVYEILITNKGFKN